MPLFGSFIRILVASILSHSLLKCSTPRLAAQGTYFYLLYIISIDRVLVNFGYKIFSKVIYFIRKIVLYGSVGFLYGHDCT